jgi:hypothetical protein
MYLTTIWNWLYPRPKDLATDEMRAEWSEYLQNSPDAQVASPIFNKCEMPVNNEYYRLRGQALMIRHKIQAPPRQKDEPRGPLKPPTMNGDQTPAEAEEKVSP